MTQPTFGEGVEFACKYLRENGIETAKSDMHKQLRFKFAAMAGFAFIDEDGNIAPEPTPDETKAMEKLSFYELAEQFFANPSSNGDGPKFRFTFTSANTAYVDWLIEHSSSPIVFDALRDIAASVARSGLAYQGNMGEWVASYIKGDIRPPSHGGHVPAKTLYRDLLIVGTINELIEIGFTATRNDASPPNSACDVVAQACREINTEPRSFKSIKRIWLSQERVLRYF